MSPTTHPSTDNQPSPATDAIGSTGDTGAFGVTGHPADDRLTPRERHEQARPGWRSVIGIGVGAAVLASLATAGAVSAFGTPANASTTTTQQSAPLVSGGGTAVNWVSTAAAVKPSVVSVRVQTANGGGEGSGVILDTNGRVLTNNHVIAAGADAKISVVLSDGRTYQATVVGADPATDLAVIVMKNPPGGLTPATFADSSKVKVGDPVMAIGNPLGLSSTATTGIVSALNRPVTTAAEAPQQEDPSGQSAQPQDPSGPGQPQDPFGQAQPQDPSGQAQAQPQGESVVTNAIQTDAAVNPGNSGGALVDAGGRVIGINSSIASLGAPQGSQPGSIGLGFAIPANEAKDVAGQLISSGTVKHAYLGVTLADGTVTLDGAEREAAVVGSVSPGTPADKGGLKAKDSIISIDGQPLEGADSLVAQVRAQHPGTTIKLTVVRDGQQKTVDLTLVARPATAG
jgi:putative serine protease PepD